LVFQKKFARGKNKIAPSQWSSFIKHFLSENPLFLSKAWEKGAFDNIL
jgi:hypothetical protein